MKLNCLIVDDEPLSIKILEKYCKELSHLAIQVTCTDAFKAMQLLKANQIDLLFLDINMPKLSGLGLLRSLKKTPMVILTTAYPEYAVEGFELDVLDYLVKPFSFERFLKAANKAIEMKNMALQIQSGKEKQSTQALLVKADRKLYQLKLEDIRYLQAYGDYVKIFTEENMLMPKETLHQIATRLPEDQFQQVHRSFIVAINKIDFL